MRCVRLADASTLTIALITKATAAAFPYQAPESDHGRNSGCLISANLVF
jgi:hypothetical protein